MREEVDTLTDSGDQRLRMSADEGLSRISLVADDVMRLTTVGIDIGSATSQLNFSDLEVERLDGRYEVTRRSLRFESPVVLTPYVDETTIDTAYLNRFIHEQYEAAGLRREEVDSGAVILTGLALAKHNSRAIGDIFADEAGKFVAVSAGDALEATFACRGSRTDELSAVRGCTVAHIDIGGGTTKLVLLRHGQIEAVAAIDVGARLVLFDDAGRVTRVEGPAQRMLETIGQEVAVGQLPGEGTIDALAAHMADQVLRHAGVLDDGGSITPGLLRTPALVAPGTDPGVEVVAVSGGVSEYVYGREDRLFGDLGVPLALALVRRLAGLGTELHEPPRGIRATVLGAAQYSLQVSGNTVYVSSERLLPLRNLPVVQPVLSLAEDVLDEAVLAAEVRRALGRSEEFGQGMTVAIAVGWEGSATYARIDALSRALVTEAVVTDRGKGPLVLIFESDVGGLIGRHVQELLGDHPLLSIDGIRVSQFDYLDLGQFVPGTGALPVVVKSLLFPPPSPEGPGEVEQDT